MALKRLRYYETEFYFPRHKNTDGHYQATGKINLYWVTPTFDREPFKRAVPTGTALFCAYFAFFVCKGGAYL